MAENLLVITVWDIMAWEGIHERTAFKRLREMRQAFLENTTASNAIRRPVTILEYCEFYAFDPIEVGNYLRGAQWKELYTNRPIQD